MHIVAAVDDRMGLLFNGRRQSRDGVLNERIASLCNGELWVSPFSATLFDGVDIVLHIDEHFLEQAADGAYCFIEDVSVRRGEIGRHLQMEPCLPGRFLL